MSRYWTSLLLLSILCVGLLGSVFVTRSALAVNPSIRLTHRVGNPSSHVNVSGKTFGSIETVSINFDTTAIGTATTNSSGAFSMAITIPSSALPGDHTVQATGQTSGISAQALFLVQSNWPMFGFNAQHTHYNPFENVLNTSNVSSLTLDWSATTATYSSPAVYNGVIYVGSSNGRLYAYDMATGTLLWAYLTTGNPFESSPTVANGIVYIGTIDTSNGKLYALNAKTGASVWTVAIGNGFLSSPVVVKGVVYIGSCNNLDAFNAMTGAIIWTAATGRCIGRSSPAVYNGVVYVGSEDHTFYAFNATTGALLWSHTTGGLIESSPAIANGIVYVGSGNSKLYAFNATTGAIVWTLTTGGVIDSSPAIANGVVYVGSEDHNLYALNAKTGVNIWTVTTTGDFIESSPAIANGMVYLSTYNGNGNMQAFDAATSATLWTYTTGGRVESSPSVANGVVYIGSFDGYFYAFHLPGTTP